MVLGGAALVIACLCAAHCSASSAGDVQMDGNAYGRVLVAFSPDLPQEDRLRTVRATKELLTSVSGILQKAIGLRIKGVVLLFPVTWDLTRVFPGETIKDATAFERAAVADILVSDTAKGRGSVFGNGPYTLQYGGCGQKGLRISLPVQFLLREDEEVNKGKILAQEWIKYRYGVFSESGFPNDPMYPLYYSIPGADETHVHVTDCANVPVTYKFLNEDGSSCSYSIDANTGRPVNCSTCKECSVVPDDRANSGVTSSLLSLQSSLSDVNYVCGDEGHAHNAASPNKQNVLCKGKSILDVLKGHRDFRQAGSETPDSQAPLPPVFHLVQERLPRIVLALDYSSRLSRLKAVLFNAATNLVYSLPAGSEFGFMKFEKNAEMVPESQNELVTIPHDNERRNGMAVAMKLGNFNASDTACVKCALLKGIQLLAHNSFPTSGTIVIMTASDPADIGPAIRDLEQYQLCLVVVIFPGATAETYKELLNNTFCSHIFQVSGEVSISTMKQLYEALDFIVSREMPAGGKSVVLNVTELSVDSPVSFVADESIKNFTVWMSSITTEIDVDNQFDILADGSARQPTRLITSWNHFAVSLQNTAAQVWTCRLHQSASIQSLLLKVVAVKNDGDVLEVDSWADDRAGDLKGDLELQPPVKLFAKVFRGSSPVVNARVTAEVKPRDGRERISLRLLDNGLGDPDITLGDGIYSRYFFINRPVSGVHEVVVRVDDNDGQAMTTEVVDKGHYPCCGRRVISTPGSPVGLFSREVKFSLTVGETGLIGYKPSTINDLHVVSVARPFRFGLQWTSPGGVTDHGKARRYIFKMFRSNSDALKDTASINAFRIEGDVTPEEHGTVQTVAIVISSELQLNESLFLTLQSVSSNGRISDISNIVQVFLSPVTDVTTTDDLLKSTLPTDSRGKLPGKTIGIIVGASLLAVLIIVLIYTAFYCCYVKRKEQANKPKDTDHRESRPPRTDGTIAASDWELDRDPISPVNSIPASILVRHHEQVKEAKRQNKDPPLFTLENLSETLPKCSSISNNNNVMPLSSSPRFPQATPSSEENLQEPAEDSTENEDIHLHRNSSFPRRITSV